MLQIQAINHKNSMPLAVLGIGSLAISQVLPAVEFQVLGEATAFAGWQASVWALRLGFGALMQLLTEPQIESAGFLLLGCAALLNLVFVAAPLVMLYRPNRLTLGIMGACAMGGFVCGIFAPEMWGDDPPARLIGYYVWLIAYVFLLLSVASSWKNFVRNGQQV